MSAGNLTQVIGVQGFNWTWGVTDESRLPQQSDSGQRGQNRLGEAGPLRRNAAGREAVSTIAPDLTSGVGILTILDNGPRRRQSRSSGQLLVNNVLLGTYTITETVAPLGYMIDADPDVRGHGDAGNS